MERKIILFWMIFALSGVCQAANNVLTKTYLTGKVTDKSTGETLPGVNVYLPDLKTGAITDADGNYRIDNLPQTKVLVQVSFIGYKLIAETIDLSVTTKKDFILEEAAVEMSEIVVTGLSKAAEQSRQPSPITIMPITELLQNSSSNIIDAIATQPGLSQITTGQGISKPVIRGLGFNRVVVVKDGIRQEGQQWGDEHGIEIDEFDVNRVEILKGPASLAYGSDALAGVINMLDAPTLPEGKIAGSFLTNYQTNNGLIGLSANVAGNRKGLTWDLRFSDKMAHAYQNKYDGYVYNSAFKENAFDAVIGLHKSWGYSHLNMSVYNLTPGIVEGERDSLTGKFIRPVVINNGSIENEIVSTGDIKSYNPFVPYQKIHHYKAVSNNNFIIGNSTIKAIFGFQQNQRQEFADVLNTGRYGLYFLLNTFNYDIHYSLPEHNNFNVSFGVNGMQQSSFNKGTEYLVPEYNLFDFGVFGIAKKSFEKLDISGGLRYDMRNEFGKDLFLNANGEKIDNPEVGSYQKFKAFHSTFTGISGSIGASYQFNEIFLMKLNFARGYRAPNISEIGSNGVHEGTLRYELGDPDLKPENSLQVDFAVGLNTHHVSAELDLFNNSIDNYIFSRKLSSIGGGDSITDGYSTFKFVSGNARLRGGEIRIDIHPHPLDWIHFENAFSYVEAIQKNQPDSMRYLPLTPAPRFQSDLKFDFRKPANFLRNAYAKIGIEYDFTQNKFYSAYNTETRTPGYTLLNMGIGSDIVSKSYTIFSIYISANNITDVAYQSHLSRLKYAEINNATGRTGVFNMGRNISFKLIIPIRIRKRLFKK